MPIDPGLLEPLTQAYSGYESRPTDYSDWMGSQGNRLGGESGNTWYGQGGETLLAPDQIETTQGQFQRLQNPLTYLPGEYRPLADISGNIDVGNNYDPQAVAHYAGLGPWERAEFSYPGGTRVAANDNPFGIDLYHGGTFTDRGLGKMPTEDSFLDKFGPMIAMLPLFLSGAGSLMSGFSTGTGAGLGGAEAVLGSGDALNSFWASQMAGVEGIGASGAAVADAGGVLGGGGGGVEMTADKLRLLADPSLGFQHSIPGISTPGSSGLIPGAATGAAAGAAAGSGGANGGVPQDFIESIRQANLATPSTPDASFSGMLSQLGNGVSLGDLFNLGTANLGSAASNFAGRFIPGSSNFSPMSIFDVGRGVYGLTQANKQKKLAQSLASSADPWGAYRGDAAARLNALSKDPSSITTTPGYAAGLEAVQRSLAAQGYQGSGNMMAALHKYGGDFYDKAIAQLSSLAGVGFNPMNAASLQLQGANDSLALTGQSLNTIGYGLSGGSGKKQLTWDDLMRMVTG